MNKTWDEKEIRSSVDRMSWKSVAGKYYMFYKALYERIYVMCGICGTIYKNSTQNVFPEQMKRMNDTLIHRGPDDEGYFIEGNVGLGQRRLSIIDVASGHQPIFNEDKSVAIVFNGEIYNYEELHKSLPGSVIRFQRRVIPRS